MAIPSGRSLGEPMAYREIRPIANPNKIDSATATKVRELDSTSVVATDPTMTAEKICQRLRPASWATVNKATMAASAASNVSVRVPSGLTLVSASRSWPGVRYSMAKRNPTAKNAAMAAAAKAVNSWVLRRRATKSMDTATGMINSPNPPKNCTM